MKPEPIIGRRVGNTTRLVDFYIQELFEKGSIIPEDHYQDSISGDQHLIRMIRFRLGNEHPRVQYKIAYDNSDKVEIRITKS